jgi:hypothetical protein
VFSSCLSVIGESLWSTLPDLKLIFCKGSVDMRFPLLHCRLASLLYYLDLGQFEQEFEWVWEVVS